MTCLDRAFRARPVRESRIWKRAFSSCALPGSERFIGPCCDHAAAAVSLQHGAGGGSNAAPLITCFGASGVRRVQCQRPANLIGGLERSREPRAQQNSRRQCCGCQCCTDQIRVFAHSDASLACRCHKLQDAVGCAARDLTTGRLRLISAGIPCRQWHSQCPCLCRRDGQRKNSSLWHGVAQSRSVRSRARPGKYFIGMHFLHARLRTSM